MPAVRRSTDEPDADHFHNGDRETDWRMSPRPVLVVVIYVLMGALSFLGSLSYWALADKINRVEAQASDTKWDVILRQTSDIGELQRRTKNTEDLATEMRELRREFDRMNLRLAKKGL